MNGRSEALPAELRAVRKAWERYWCSNHPARTYPRKKWLRRSNLWGYRCYHQPAVHYDWLAFKAGVEWQAKRK